MYRDIVTVYNRREGPGGDVTWWPTVLSNVDLNEDQAVVAAQYGTQSAGKALLHVHYDIRDGKVMTQGKQYLPPKEWQARETPKGTFTFTPGERFDFFAVGDYGDDPVPDADYTGGYYDHMVRTTDGVYAVNTVSRFSVIPHFEVVGK